MTETSFIYNWNNQFQESQPNIRNELLYQNGQKKYVQLHLNQNKFEWLFLNQWFGLHMEWLFPNDVSTTPTSSTTSLQMSKHIKKFFPIFIFKK